jgi:hypothetical protein
MINNTLTKQQEQDVLPDQDFFTPTPAFKDWVLAQHWLRYRTIIDAGAGRGLMSMVLRSFGLDVTAIDLHERPVDLGKVQIEDATQREYESDDVLIIARPCHGGWHEKAYSRALRQGCEDLLYIGLERNIAADFGDDWEIELLVENIGAQGENIWRVYGRRPELTNYSQLDSGAWGKLRQRERNGEPELQFVNDAGGYCPVQAKQLTDARLKTHAYQGAYVDPDIFASRSQRAAGAMHADRPHGDKGGYGWIGPEGRWYPCGSMDHDAMLHRSFGISRQRCEELGFIKCYGSFWANEGSHAGFGRQAKFESDHASAVQIKTLREVGYKVEDEQAPEDRGVETLSQVEQDEVAAAITKPKPRNPKTGYRSDRPGD